MKKFILLILFFLSFFAFFIYKKKYQKSVSPLPQSGTADLPLLTLAVVGDPESDLQNLKKALQKIKELKIRHLVIVGDLTTTGTPAQFEDIKGVLADKEINIYTLCGNHDLWYFKETGDDVYSRYFGKPYYQKEINAINFFFLDNSNEQVGFSQEQLSWLKEQISASKEKIIIISHIPLFHHQSKKAMGEYNEALKLQAQEVLELLCQKETIAVISGHLHKAEVYQYQCSQAKKIKMINAGSINNTRNWQLPRFLQIEIYKEDLKIKEIELE